tara:strand:- start:99 stop:1796 length:1698 start_codon:yes stop_codon:yes gene_type:complete
MARLDSSGLKLIERLRSDSERQLQFRPPDDAQNDDDYAGIGAFLRQTREQHGLDLFSVASVLRIQVAHLDAIESGDFQRLPGATYAVGFLRSYGNYLGLDADDVVRRFKEETEIAPAQTKLVFPEPVEETRRPGLRTAFVTILIAAGIYGGWIYLERHGQFTTELVSEPPQRFANMVDSAEPKPSPPQGAAQPPVPGVIASPAQANADATAEVTSAEGSSGGGATLDGSAPASGEDTGATGMTEATEPETAASVADAGSAEAEPVPAAEASPLANAAMMAAAGPSPTPTRVQVTPADSEEAIARADAVAEQGSADQSASPVEQAAAAEVALIARQTVSEAEALQGDATQPSAVTEEAAVVVPPVRPSALATAPRESPHRLTAAVAPTTPASQAPVALTAERAVAPSSNLDDEDSAPAIPQIQARVAPPQPPSIPAAPPPAPRLDSAATGSGGTADTAGGDTPALRYRPQIYGVAADNARVVVRAKADSWVQVQGANNELLLTRILRAGDTYNAPDRRDLVMMTGNAGAIEVLVDGKVLGTLGPLGAVRRNINLHAEGLHAFVQGR